MASKKLKHKTLSEKISETFTPHPQPDPENDSEDETTARFAEIDEDDDFDFGEKQLSEFRKRNVKQLSEYSDKYKGEVSSRKELLAEEQESEGSEDDLKSNEDKDLEKYRRRLKNCQLESEPDESLGTDEEVETERLEQPQDEEDDDSDYDSPGEEVSDSEGVTEDEGKSDLLKESDDNTNIKKGLAVQAQLKVWEKLLEIRIHSQKMLIKANSLPQPEAYGKLCAASEEFVKLAEVTKQNVTNLLDKMIEMQTSLTSQFPETSNLLKSAKKRHSSSSDSGTESPTKKFASLLQNNFENFRGYRNSVLQKWHDRTKILTPGSSKGNRRDFDVIQKIEASLLNKSDLIKKSQMVKGNYKLFHRSGEAVNPDEPLGNDAEDGNDGQQNEVSSTEIYDDTDFYHQQLRELIEFKANIATSPSEMTRQLADLQKLRQKMKRKVDTRASKGRKIRYVVHNKLVNFMAPYENSEWTDESKNELYRSLFAT